MKTRSIKDFREPYVRGPHIRYFLTAMLIAIVVALIVMVGITLILQLVYPMD